jgi:hypothetical protein
MKLYFLNALHHFAIEGISSSLPHEGFVPTKAYFEKKNWSFLTQPSYSFVLDFSNESQVETLAILIGLSPTSKWLLYSFLK